jgi:hypothetical protein
MSNARATLGELREAWLGEGPKLFENVVEEMDHDDPGYSYNRIFKRLSDGTFWMASGVRQASGEYDTLRDDCKGSTEKAYQVFPHLVTSTIYKATP